MLKKNGDERIKAGTVSIVDAYGKELYFARIFQEKNTYIVNHFTRKLNGFTEDSLENGRPLDEVKREVEELLTGKLVVTYAGSTDLLSLELNPGDFDHLDLSNFFMRPKPNKMGQDYGEKIGLRTLCYHYFNKDIQEGIHSPTVDAKATIQLFMEVYTKIPEVHQNRDYKNYQLFSHIVKYP